MNKLILGVFDDERRLLDACREARAQGLSIVDAYTPFAVHGLDEAMGLRRTRLPLACFLLGLAGLAVALGFQLWSTAVDWPLNIGGKSDAALPALIPITFELTILFAAVGVVIVFFFVVRLWPGQRYSLAAAGITDDRFALVVGAPDAATACALLEERGALEAREVQR